MEWTEESIQRLRALWAEGLSTAEIGRRLGVSKNAVVGKAHRLDLTARPSPIRWDSAGTAPRRRERRSPAVPRAEGPTLPPLSSTASSLPPAEGAAIAPARRPEAPPRPSVSATAPTAAKPLPRPVPPPPSPPRLQQVPAPRPYGRVVTCCWPLGEPGTKSFHFCDAASVPGKPYCDEHAQLAYVKVRDRREDAA
jgi:GcrA cell cycle regulator